MAIFYIKYWLKTPVKVLQFDLYYLLDLAISSYIDNYSYHKNSILIFIFPFSAANQLQTNQSN